MQSLLGVASVILQNALIMIFSEHLHKSKKLVNGRHFLTPFFCRNSYIMIIHQTSAISLLHNV